jgi:hypothetical protein
METCPPNQAGPTTEESSPSTSAIQKPTRSRKGCFSCRRRKVKCDEIPPQCRNCRIGDRQVCHFKDERTTADDSVIGRHLRKYQRTRNGDTLPRHIVTTTMDAGEGVLQVCSISSSSLIAQRTILQLVMTKPVHRLSDTPNQSLHHISRPPSRP